MHIDIADRFRPYSHTPGIFLVLPKTTLRFQIFPSQFIIHNLANMQQEVKTVKFDVKGPVKDFTALLDLEKFRITAWGHASNGFFRYHLIACDTNNYKILWDKKPSKTTEINSNLEILSLGNNKTQNLDQIRSRCDLVEILPLWYKLGQVIPQPTHYTNHGTASLFDACRKSLSTPTITDIVPAFKNVYMAAFDAGFSPRLEDSQHQGFDLPPLLNNDLGSAIQILTEGYRLIRKMFIQENEESLSILPALPPEFHCGRLKNLTTKFGVIDIEWSKKTIRRMVMKSDVTQNLLLHLNHDIRTFRVRRVENEKGIFYTRKTPIQIEAGKTYLLDRFEK